jgi:hypothetical protein
MKHSIDSWCVVAQYFSWRVIKALHAHCHCDLRDIWLRECSDVDLNEDSASVRKQLLKPALLDALLKWRRCLM